MKNITITGSITEHGAFTMGKGFHRYSYVLIEPDDGGEPIRVVNLSARDELNHYLASGSVGTFLIARHNGVNTLFAVRNAESEVVDPRLPKLLNSTHPLIYLTIALGVLFVPLGPFLGLSLAGAGVLLFITNKRRKSALSQAVSSGGFSLRQVRQF